MKRKKLIWMIPVGIVGMALFIALGGEIVRLLWNSLLPALFGLREITFWQGLGLLVLCRILFGGFGFHGSGGSNARRRMRDRMAERWESMTPEDRERFRVYMRERCGFSRPNETKPSE